MPFAAFAPLQPPEAAHAVAFVLVQLRLEEPPAVTLAGFAANVSVGAGGVPTLTVTLAIGLVPPAPVHWSENRVVAVRLEIVSFPDALFAPDQPPEAVQPVAFVEVQVSWVLPPAFTVVGFAVRVPVGVGTGVGPGSACSLSSPPHAARNKENVANAAKRALRNMARGSRRLDACIGPPRSA